MSIPAVGGGPAHGLQRALMEAAERALADEMEMLDGTEAGAASGAGTASAARAARRPATATAAARAGDTDPAVVLEEAIVVELTEGESEELTVADGWITTPRRGPLEVRGEPVPRRFESGDVKGAESEGQPEAAGAPGRPSTAAQAGQTPTQTAQAGQSQVGQGGQAQQTPANPAQAGQTGEPASSQPTPGRLAPMSGQPAPASATPGQTPDAAAQQLATDPEPTPAGPSLERLIVVLKKTGIDFRDAYQVLREIRGDEPLPARAELRAQWQAADPGAWQERTATAPERAAVPQPQPDELPVDDLIRDRGWHRAADPERPPGPSLHGVVRDEPANQQYVAGLTTAEFQRLVTILGGTAPAWFWELRGHRGLRGLAERPAIARLNATRIAGTRLGAWILALLGMAVLWYVGVHSRIWW